MIDTRYFTLPANSIAGRVCFGLTIILLPWWVPFPIAALCFVSMRYLSPLIWHDKRAWVPF